MINCPGPECGVLFISIVDIISRSALAVFSLFLASNYHYNMGPIIVDNITILTIHGGIFCIIFLQLILIRWDINIILISIYNIVLKNEQNVQFYIELQ